MKKTIEKLAAALEKARTISEENLPLFSPDRSIDEKFFCLLKNKLLRDDHEKVDADRLVEDIRTLWYSGVIVNIKGIERELSNRL